MSHFRYCKRCDRMEFEDDIESHDGLCDVCRGIIISELASIKGHQSVEKYLSMPDNTRLWIKIQQEHINALKEREEK